MPLLVNESATHLTTAEAVDVHRPFFSRVRVNETVSELYDSGPKQESVHSAGLLYTLCHILFHGWLSYIDTQRQHDEGQPAHELMLLVAV